MTTSITGASQYVLTDVEISEVLSEATVDGAKANIGVIASGSYTGNDTVNRAIPHGLDIIPKIILICVETDAYLFKIHQTGFVSFLADSSRSMQSVTEFDDTNFYVGNIATYTQSGNSSALVYNWVAFA